MSAKEQVLEEIETLSEAEIREVAEYLAFLKYRSRNKPRVVDESQLAALYAEFAEEDRGLAEEGMADYTAGLIKEDV
jgi:cytochrome c553